MSSLPQQCLVDTNVPKTANLATDAGAIATDLVPCVLSCVEAIEHVIRQGELVLDAGDEIFDEYRRQLSMRGQPGVGDQFMKWVHDHRWMLPDKNRVPITVSGDSYLEFPTHPGLVSFDRSDRKFIAVANAHPNKPPILEATDSKWWGWQTPLAEVGINVHFVCAEYAAAKYQEKMGT